MTQGSSVEVEYTITEDEYVKANMLFSIPTRKHKYMYAVTVTILVIAALIGNDAVVRGAALGGLIGGGGGFLISRYMYAPWKTRRMYRNYAAASEPVTIQLKDEGIKFLSDMGESTIGWRHILRWRENSEFVLVFQAPHLYHVIPKRVGEIAYQISEALLNHVGSKS